MLGKNILVVSGGGGKELTLTIVWDGRLGSVSMGGQHLCNGDANTTEDFIIPYSTIQDLTAEIRAYRDGLSGTVAPVEPVAPVDPDGPITVDPISTKASSINIEYLRSESGFGYSYQYYRIIDITKSAVLVL